MGHEYSVIVSKIGKDVTNLKVGDRVAVEPLYFCESCQPCKEDFYNTCNTIGFQGLSGDGALVEPIAVAYHSLRKGQFKAGQTAIVSGAGTIGYLQSNV